MYVFSASQKRVSVEFVGTDKVQEKLNNFNELPVHLFRTWELAQPEHQMN
jgi:hypothetical protein